MRTRAGAEMPDSLDALAQPAVEARAPLRLSKVWIVPALAALIALSVFFQKLAREGPDVVITFPAAQGIEAGKTAIRYKDVAIGKVTSVALSPDLRTVQVTARITRQAAPLMTEGAAFWIVRPTVTLSQVSGLDTLLSGNYIAFERGRGVQPAREFVGLDNATVVGPDTPGREFVLRARDSLRVGVGLPVYYLGLEVGQVTSTALVADGVGIDVHVFVKAPYDAYVGPTTRFWNASGLDLSMRGGDVNVRTESVIALLVGGIAFENLDAGRPATEAPSKTQFMLYRNRGAALKADDPRDGRYVVFFDEPIDGVQVASPVAFLGVQVGEVHKVGLALDPRSGRVRGRVELTVSPARAMQAGVELSPGDGPALLRALVVRHGVRAQLRTSSLLTGQRYVAFDYFRDAAPVHVDWGASQPVLPSVPSVLPAFEQRVARLMDKLDAMPLVEAVADARTLMHEARGTFAAVHSLSDDVDRKALPQFVSTMREAEQALDSAQRMLDGATATLVGPDAPGQRDLRAALQEMTRAARALRTMSDSLERHPESLVWGRSIQPEAR